MNADGEKKDEYHIKEDYVGNVVHGFASGELLYDEEPVNFRHEAYHAPAPGRTAPEGKSFFFCPVGYGFGYVGVLYVGRISVNLNKPVF